MQVHSTSVHPLKHHGKAVVSEYAHMLYLLSKRLYSAEELAGFKSKLEAWAAGKLEKYYFFCSLRF